MLCTTCEAPTKTCTDTPRLVSPPATAHTPSRETPQIALPDCRSLSCRCGRDSVRGAVNNLHCKVGRKNTCRPLGPQGVVQNSRSRSRLRTAAGVFQGSKDRPEPLRLTRVCRAHHPHPLNPALARDRPAAGPAL